jgi:predicted short-subunit dehydrogenase-like oxidoreductase (DUF2520 family)
MRITIIGSGNVATVLARKILHGGHIIHQIFSSNSNNSKKLADEVSASSINDITDLDDGADIFIVAVSDDSLQHIASWMKPLSKLVVHTAGSIPMEVLKTVSINYGVLYPLQSLRKETHDLPHIPILIDASSPWNLMKLSGFAQSFAESVHQVGDDERRKLHLAAVMSSNFSNYLLALTEKYCEKERVDFKLLLPLLEETVKRMEQHSPSQLQTGPAIRKDETTLEKHRMLLHDHPDLLEVYNYFSERIMRMS